MTSALIIMCKAPVPGHVKTRLIPELGENKATIIYQQLLDNTINQASFAQFDKRLMYVDVHHPFLRQLAAAFSMSVRIQMGKDLGEKMYNALDESLRFSERVILIGSDCPELSPGILEHADHLLERGNDLVIGPTSDGGYFLIGMRIANGELFEGIQWSTSRVLEQTLAQAKYINLRVSLLEELWDVDEPEDYKRWQSQK